MQFHPIPILERNVVHVYFSHEELRERAVYAGEKEKKNGDNRVREAHVSTLHAQHTHTSTFNRLRILLVGPVT